MFADGGFSWALLPSVLHKKTPIIEAHDFHAIVLLTVNSMHLISRIAPKQPTNESRQTSADVMTRT